jgi:AMP-polyphosphate phosphotransferase
MRNEAEMGSLAIDLADYEEGKAFDGDQAVEYTALRQQLAELQSLHIANDCRTLIVIEGWDGAGRGAIARAIGQSLDPRFLNAFHVGQPGAEVSGRHFLWRFWQKLPGKGEITLLDRSYYRRVLDERVDGLCSATEWSRAFDEINEFEAQQRDSGTHVIKLFLHIAGEQQRHVLTERLHDPARRWAVSAAHLHRLSTRTAYVDALHDMFERCDTRWAPWKVIDANNPSSAEIAVLTHLANELATKLPSTFPDIGQEAAALAELVLASYE